MAHKQNQLYYKLVNLHQFIGLGHYLLIQRKTKIRHTNKKSSLQVNIIMDNFITHMVYFLYKILTSQYHYPGVPTGFGNMNIMIFIKYVFFYTKIFF